MNLKASPKDPLRKYLCFWARQSTLLWALVPTLGPVHSWSLQVAFRECSKWWFIYIGYQQWDTTRVFVITLTREPLSNFRTKYLIVKGSRPLSLQNKWQVKQNAGHFSTKLEASALGRQWENGAGVWVRLCLTLLCLESSWYFKCHSTRAIVRGRGLPGSFLLQFKQLRLLQVLGPDKSFEITCGFEDFMRLNQGT